MIGSADIFQRTMMLIGEDKIEKLSKAKIAVCGLGGVGSFAFEALVRCGVGNFVIVDKDRVVPSNLNRQLIATIPNIGRYKVDIARERAVEINPFVKIEIIPNKITSENIYKIFGNKNLDYIVDAIDDIGAKVALIKFASKENIKIISCMGMGNRINPLLIKVSDIYSTRYCPLAKKLRSILRKENIKSLKVVYSEEKPSKPDYRYLKEESEKKHVPASISFVPPVAGFIMAYEVVKDLVFGD
ncbi:UBA/THIF-type NAD/FAD binding protein [Caldicellulosiruptor acetigenus I77R1B]|uniref:UBA/THIF-type NAD/FAD binding protein n=1 Tax=Caldicellulosiruptor acetigenus (strain ATCC 700853 / DSM 12137 / I77R1B) TaxID=632335 RepID=E4S8V4_CALA7|nr:tRNA threonylcarbamoyladenosine dehydratase [Caldicellulosiruptor acetigenus]ADQ40951.1 UBA/THIF-type NAD/FAD binding protein [Caldicellulosiruptor acetigenus I77R1B]